MPAPEHSVQGDEGLVNGGANYERLKVSATMPFPGYMLEHLEEADWNTGSERKSANPKMSVDETISRKDSGFRSFLRDCTPGDLAERLKRQSDLHSDVKMLPRGSTHRYTSHSVSVTRDFR